MTQIRNEVISGSVSQSALYILETNDTFFKLARWKAKLIQWFHLEMFFGKVYGTDDRGLWVILDRVNGLATQISSETDKEKVFTALTKLSSCLHSVKGDSDLLSTVRQHTTDVALTFFQSRRSLSDSKTKRVWNEKLGVLLANQFLQDVEGGRTDVASNCKKICAEIEQYSSDGAKEILTSFFKKVLKEVRDDNLETIEEVYTQRWEKEAFTKKAENAFYTYSSNNTNASPEDVADWFKKELEKISCSKSPYVPEAVHSLISTMRCFLPAWKFRVALQSFGIFVSQSCRDDIIFQFEEIAKNFKSSFSSEEIAFVMEGFVERKGGLYCRAVAQKIAKSEQIGEGLVEYAKRARELYGEASRGIIQVVVENIFETKDDQKAFLIEEFTRLFILQSEKEKDYTILAPFLGSSIRVQKPIAPGAVQRSFSATKLKRLQSQKNIFSQLNQSSSA
jgi:hypothetical protein